MPETGKRGGSARSLRELARAPCVPTEGGHFPPAECIFTPMPNPDEMNAPPMTSFDPYLLRGDFPFFEREEAVWLDNAATTQKPRAVLDRVLAAMTRASGVHRAVYALAEETTLAYEEARAVLADFIGAPSKDEIVFTSGATAGINFLARSLYAARRRAGAKAFRVVTSVLEHHSNVLPWRMLGEEGGAACAVVGHDARGGVDMEALAAALARPCDVVALTLCSNVSGAWLDTRRAAELARGAGALLFLDAAQAVAHRPLCVGACSRSEAQLSGGTQKSNESGSGGDSPFRTERRARALFRFFDKRNRSCEPHSVCSCRQCNFPNGNVRTACGEQEPVERRFPLDADAIAFSGHKMYAPDGSGVLWARRSLLEELAPVSYGGEMVLSVGDADIQWNRPPRCFEAGTPNVSAVLGLASAAAWLRALPREAIRAHEDALGQMLHDEIGALPGARVFSEPGPLCSFTLDGWHAHDLAAFLDTEGLALRAGRLCAEPFVRALGVPALVRASLAAYTTREECTRLLAALRKANALRGGYARS